MYRGERSGLGRVFASAVVRKWGYMIAAGLAALVMSQCAHASEPWCAYSYAADGIVYWWDQVEEYCVSHEPEVWRAWWVISGGGGESAAPFLPPLSVVEGTAIGAAILLAWAIAFSFRLLARFIEGWESKES